MDHDYWNYLVKCDYASKMSGGINKRQKNKKKEYSEEEWASAIIAGILVLIGVFIFECAK